MSDEMIDFSNYDGDYQEGELLGEDGQAIDMEDLKGDKPPRAPLVIKLMFVLLCVSVGAVSYWTFIHKAPPPPPPPPPAKVERHKTFDTALGKIQSIRTKEFAPIAKCWDVLAQSQTKKKAATQALLAKACPAMKAGAVTYKPQCSDAACTNVLLASCKGAACTPVAGAHYIDLVYMKMQRVADSYNRLMATIRLYERASKQLKRLTKAKGDTSKMKPELERLDAALQKILTGKGMHNHWHMSYFGLTDAKFNAQAFAALQALKPSDAAAPPKKKKRRRRRRRRRKKAKAAAGAATLWGGTLYGDAKWPVVGLDHPNFKELAQNKIEFDNDSIPATIESRADAHGVKGALKYSPAAVYFWTSMLLQSSFHKCASKYAKTKTYTATFASKVQSETGRLFGDGTTVTVDPPSPEVAACLTHSIRKNLVTFGYRALPPEPKRVTMKFKVVLKP